MPPWWKKTLDPRSKASFCATRHMQTSASPAPGSYDCFGTNAQVLAHQKSWLDKFAEPQLSLISRSAHLHWDPKSVQACEREFFVPLLLLLHNSKKLGNKLEATFALSDLWRRKGVARNAEALLRSEFRDWTKLLDLVGTGNPDQSVEKRQHNAGFPPQPL